MMKRLGIVLFLVFCIGISQLGAQHYVYEKIVGASPHLQNFRGERDLLLTGPVNDELSEWQEMPFEWSFYGEKVAGYHVTENGYITFDSTATESVARHTAIPSAKSPNNAIFACWGDWKLLKGRRPLSKSVSRFTYGEAPNRKHVISWIGLSPAVKTSDSRSSTNLFLIIKEQGDFEILMNVSRRDTSITSTVGLENADGTRATMVANSPDFEYPHLSTQASDDITWRFEYSENDYQARITSTNLPDVAAREQPQDVTAKVWNLGTETIASFAANYRTEDGNIYTQLIDGVNVARNEKQEVVFEQPWKPDEAGSFEEFSFWISDINRMEKNMEKAPHRQKVFVNLGKSAEKKVLIEEFTGAWCGWCPDGMVQISNLEKKLNGIVPVALHVRDSMETQAAKELADFHSPAFPESMINRRLWAGEPSIPVSRTENRWYKYAKKALSKHSPVEISINPQFDKETRAFHAEVRADFVDYAIPGDLRLHFYVVEDKVTGEGKGYDQANYYSNNEDYVGHTYYDDPDPMKGFSHKHVLRKSLSETWGTPDVIGDAPQPGSSFSHTYEWALPADYDAGEVTLIAFVSYHDSDLEERYILNVATKQLVDS